MEKTSGIGTGSEDNNKQIGTHEHTPEYVGARPPVKKHRKDKRWMMDTPICSRTMRHYHIHKII